MKSRSSVAGLKMMLISTGAMVLLAVPAMGQTVDPADAPSQAAPQEVTADEAPVDDGSLAEIVVTGERRETSLQDTPQSILAFGEDKLESMNVSDISELQQFLPNVSIGGAIPFGGSFPIASIRGIGQSSARPNSERGVALYVDDLYFPRSTGSLLRLLDVERIEVLRGPQGTLFGRNAVGGLIHYISKKPTNSLEGHVAATYGSFNRVDLDGLINIPITDTLSGRFQAGYSNKDGYVREYDYKGDFIGTAGGQEDYAVRGALRFRPSASLTIDATATYTKVTADPPPTIIDAVAPWSPGNIGQSADIFDYYYRVLQGQPRQAVNDPRRISPGRYDYQYACFKEAIFNPALAAATVGLVNDPIPADRICDTYYGDENVFLNVSAKLDLNEHFSLSSITGYQDLKTRSSVDQIAQALPRRFNIDTKVFSQEMQLLYSSGRLNGILGLVYYDEKVSSEQQEAVVYSVGALAGQCCSYSQTDFDQKVRSLGVFGSMTFSVTDKFDVIVGLRYTNDRKTGAVAISGTAGGPISFGKTFESFDYRVTVDYNFTESIMAFATVSSGFKAGGFGSEVISFVPYSGSAAAPGTPWTPQVLTLDPERVTNYEAGLRTDWFDRRVRLNVTGFMMNYDGIIVQGPDYSTGASPQFSEGNAVDARIYGFEGEFNARITNNLSVNANIGYTGIDYRRILPGGIPLIRTAASPASCNTADPLNTGCSIQRLQRTPEWKYTLGAEYAWPMFGGDMRFNATYAFTDELESSNNASTNSRVLDSYGLLDLRLSYQTPRYEVALFASNLLDKYYATSGGVGNIFIGFGGTYLNPGPPREGGITVKLKF